MPVHDAENTLATDMLTDSREGFDRIYSKFAPALLGYLLEIIPDRNAANVILQKSFVEIWRSKHDYNRSMSAESLFMWMISITKRNALSFVTVKSDIQSGVLFVNTLRSINSVSPDEVDKFILKLMYLYDYSLKDISEALIIDESKLKKMLRTAVSKLKTLPDE